MIKISPNLVNFLVLTSGIKIKLLLFFVIVTSNIALMLAKECILNLWKVLD